MALVLFQTVSVISQTRTGTISDGNTFLPDTPPLNDCHADLLRLWLDISEMMIFLQLGHQQPSNHDGPKSYHRSVEKTKETRGQHIINEHIIFIEINA